MHEINAGELDTDALIARYAPDRTTPRVRVNFVSSIDGAVEVGGFSGGLGSNADKVVFAILRMVCDGVMVGAGTLRHERYGPLRIGEEHRAWRVAAGLAPHPRLVIVSGSLDLDPASAALAEAPVRPIVITHAACDDDKLGGKRDDKRDALSAVADVLVHGVDRVDLISAVAELRDAYQLGQILCEGGPQLFGALHAADLVDEVCLTVSPLVAGPGAGRIIAGPERSGTERSGTERSGTERSGNEQAVSRMRLAHAIVADDGSLLLRYAR